MGSQDEIAQLRSDLVALMAQARVLARRIDALEAERGGEAVPLNTSHTASPPAPAESLPSAPFLREAVAPTTQAPTAKTMAADEVEEPRPKPKPAPMVPGWSLGDALKKAFRAMGPKEAMSWEMALGTYWLPRVAVLLLAVGVVWALTLAVQRWGQEWMPFLRIGAGYAIAAGLFLGGKFIERKSRKGAEQSYKDYARVMMAGGMALLYFVTFATHYVPYTRIFEQPYVTLALLSAIVTGWGVVAEWRRSLTLAFAVTVLGHFTVGLSTVTLPDPPGAAVAGLLLLNLGAGYFFARHGWRTVGLAGVLGGYGNYALWLANSTPSDSLWALAGGIGVLVAYWMTFAIAEYMASQREDVRPSYRIRSAYLGINSGGLVLLGVGLIEGFEIAQPYRFAFLFAVAAAFLAFGLLYRRTRPSDILYGAYLTKASAVFTLGLADYFEGSALTVSLAVEAVVLLHSAKRSGLVAPRALAMGVFAVAFLHGMGHLLNGPEVLRYGNPDYPGRFTASAGAVLALLYFAILHERTRWAVMGSANFKAGSMVQAMLHGLTLAARPLSSANVSNKVHPQSEGGPWPMNPLFAVSAAVLGMMSILHLFSHCERAAALALLALLFVAAALATQTASSIKASIFPGMAAFLLWNLSTADVESHTSVSMSQWVSAALTAGAMLAIAEAKRLGLLRYRDKSGGRWPFELLPFAWTLAASEVFSSALFYFLDSDPSAILLLILALCLSSYAFWLGSTPVGLSSFIAFVPGVLTAYSFISRTDEIPGVVLLVVLGAAIAMLSEERWFGSRPGLRFHQRQAGPYVLYGGLACLVAWAALKYWPNMHLPGVYALIGLGIGAACLTTILHPRALTAVSTSYLVFACLICFNHCMITPPGVGIWVRPIWIAVIATLAAGRYLTWRDAFPYRVPESLLLAASFSAMLAYLNYLPPHDWGYARSLILAMCFLIYGAGLRLHVAGILSLLTGIVVTIQVFFRAYDDLSVDGRVAGLGAAVFFWFLVERLFSYARHRKLLPENIDLLSLTPALVAVPVVLLLITLERVPILANFYLTIAWTLAAVGVMGVALLTKERYYRYAALCMFTLALGRVMLVDTRELDGIYRILAVLFLGVVLLAVGYGYIKARERASRKDASDTSTSL